MENVLIIKCDETTLIHSRHKSKRTINVVSADQEIRIFSYEHVRYVLDVDNEQFVRLRNFDSEFLVNDLIQSNRKGVSASQRENL